MFGFESLTIVVATFLLAGMVKGVIGLGLPTVCLGILTVAIDLALDRIGRRSMTSDEPEPVPVGSLGTSAMAGDER